MSTAYPPDGLYQEGTGVNRPKGLEEEFCHHVEQTNEIGLYMIINSLNAVLAQMGYDLKNQPDLRKNPEALKGIQDDVITTKLHIDYAVLKTKRFGVNPLDEDGGVSEEYLSWLVWWDTYVKALSLEQWEVLKARIENNEDLSMYQPAGTWRLPDVMDGGVIPASYIKDKVTPEEAFTEQVRFSVGEVKWKNFIGFLRPCTTDHLRRWSGPGDRKGITESGICLIRNRRAFTKLVIETKSSDEGGN